MKIRDRIVELRRVPASSLAPNPHNWRTHPEKQQNALRGILAEVGIADAVLARERADGVLELVDGHLRVETLGDREVPVLVLDLDDEESLKVLATIDPLAAMAETDPAKLDDLLKQIEIRSAAVNAMLAEVAADGDGDDGGGVVADDGTYTSVATAPIYEPSKAAPPPISELVDRSKTESLIAEIDAADIPPAVATFLRYAAERHSVFDFAQIAEFYSHADEATQSLFEKSALVIIDMNAAIENGFVHLTKQVAALMQSEKGDGNAE